jgi:hypothetical protein
MRVAAGFHADHAALQIREELHNVLALELLAQNRLAPLINSMHLKDVFCQIGPNCRNLHFGRSFPFQWIEPISTLAP